MKKLIVAIAAAGMLAGGASSAVAGPYDNSGDGTGPGRSGDNSVYGLCTAYSNNSDKAKEKSPVFSGRDWAEICEEVSRPGGGE